MNSKLLTLFVILFVSAVYCEEEEAHNNEVDPTILLNDDNFNSEIAAGNFFVMFYAPW